MKVCDRKIAAGIVFGLALLGGAATAEEPSAPIELTIKDHRFSPAEIHVASGKPTLVHITNLDSTAEEFEIRQLAIEKVVAGGGNGSVRIRPLGPGKYAFIGEYHEDTAQGTIVVE
jgi:plastocyanin